MLEGNYPFDEGENRVIGALAHIFPWMEFGAALPNDDFAWLYELTAKALYAEPLGNGVASEVG